MHELWIDTEHPEHLLLGTDGGLYSSWNRGESWLHLNTLPIAEFYRVSLHGEGEDYEVLGGTQDNASLVAPLSATLVDERPDDWSYVFLDRWDGGDGFATFPDPSGDGTVYYEQQKRERTQAAMEENEKRKQANQKAADEGAGAGAGATDAPVEDAATTESVIERLEHAADHTDLKSEFLQFTTS